MALIYDNSGYGPTPNQTEWGGISDNTPPLTTAIQRISSYNAGGQTIVPPPGCTVMQLVTCSSSDGHYFGSTAYRVMTRRAVNFPTYGEGYEQAVVIAACKIETMPSNMYVSPFEYHQTGNKTGNNDTGVTPTHIILNGNGLTIDAYGGSFAAGGIGNPGRQQLFGLNFNGGKYTTLYKWHVFVHHMRFSSSNNGLANVYHGVQGIDSAVVSLTGLRTNATTCFQGRGMYELCGLYHNVNGTVRLLIADWKAYTTVAEAVSEAAILLGGDPGQPPPPPPPPDPTNDVEPADWMGGRYAITDTLTLGSVADKQRCSRIVLSHTGSLTGMGAYIAPVTGTPAVETFRFALWPDNGAGTEPGAGAPLGVTTEVSIDQNDPPQRYTADFLTPTSGTAGQVVWGGMHMGGNANEAIIRYQSVPNSFRLMDAPYANGTVAWDSTIDVPFDIEMVTWVRGTQTSGSVPQNLSAPIIAGTPEAGQQLVCISVGLWSAPTGAAVIQWQRDGQGNGNYSNVGIAGSAYTLTTADIGSRIRVLVSVTNAIGTGTSPSNALGPVTSASVPAGSTGRSAFAGHSTTSTRSTSATRRAYEGGGG